MEKTALFRDEILRREVPLTLESGVYPHFLFYIYLVVRFLEGHLTYY